LEQRRNARVRCLSLFVFLSAVCFLSYGSIRC
jgi:hypothetical protein